MAVHSTLMDFHVDTTLTDDRDDWNDLREKLQKVLHDDYNLKVVHNSKVGERDFITFLKGANGSNATLRGYAWGFLTLTLEECISNAEPATFSSEVLIELENRLKLLTRSKKTKRQAKLVKLDGLKFPPIKRGSAVDPYCTTSDERLLEYDVDHVLYEAKSRYQNIKIVHTRSFGNLLLLDGLQNLAESDLVYTQTLMQQGIENYAGKKVLILGGGDGGLLHELLKEDPAWVTMIENYYIDEMVMDACSKHLRSVCGNCLDVPRKGPNYEIIIDDCVKIMEKFIIENEKFDYIFGDLTDIPITPSPQGEFWDFVHKILKLAFRLLSPTGRFLTHGNGASSVEALKMYELQLEHLDCPVEYRKQTAYVPSFMELWVFYIVWKKNLTNNGSNYTNGSLSALI